MSDGKVYGLEDIVMHVDGVALGGFHDVNITEGPLLIRHTVSAPARTGKGVEVAAFSFTLESVETRIVPKYGRDLIEVDALATILDRDTGRPIPLRFREQYPAEMGGARAVRLAVHTMVCHEADECIYVHGERVYDPHKGDVRPVELELKPLKIKYRDEP